MQTYYHACSTLLVLLTSCATANEPSSIYKCQPLELARSVASIELTEYLKEQYPEEQIRYANRGGSFMKNSSGPFSQCTFSRA